MSAATYTERTAVARHMERRILHGGSGSYACPRSVWLLACPLKSDGSRREGTPCQIRRGSVTSPVFSGPGLLRFRASRPAPGAAGAGATACAPSRRRQRPLGGALNPYRVQPPYRKFSQGVGPRQGELGRGELGRCAVPLDACQRYLARVRTVAAHPGKGAAAQANRRSDHTRWCLCPTSVDR